MKKSRSQTRLENLEVRFEIGGLPIAEPRKRVRVVNGKPQVYQPDDDPVAPYKQMIQYVCRTAKPFAWRMDLPMQVDLLFIFPRPASFIADMGALGRRWHANVPDTDNLAKAVLDAMNKEVYDDDRQVCDLRVVKLYARVDEEPCARIRVRPKWYEVPGPEIEI